MTEKEHAKVLYEAYFEYSDSYSEKEFAIKSALIHVNGVLDVIRDSRYSKHLMVNDFFQYSKNIQYWQLVREELESMFVNRESTS